MRVLSPAFVLSLGLLAGSATGCVFRYGQLPEAEAPPWAEAPEDERGSIYQNQLLDLEDRARTLLDGGDLDVDQADRVATILGTARQARALDEGAQAVIASHLDAMLAIEERQSPDAFAEVNVNLMEELLEVGVSEVVVEEEILEVEESVVPEPLPANPEVISEQARELLAQWQHEEAIEVLRPHHRAEFWPELSALWQEAVDGHVHTERERAGERFIRARKMDPGPDRQMAMEDVLVALRDLIEAYPETSYSEALTRNIRVVEADLRETGGR